MLFRLQDQLVQVFILIVKSVILQKFKDYNGYTPLYHGHLEIVKELFNHGAGGRQPNIKCSHGWTPLHLASMYGFGSKNYSNTMSMLMFKIFVA